MSFPSSSEASARVSLSQRLQTVTEALAAAQTQADVLEIVLTPALNALDAIAGAVLLVDSSGQRLERMAIRGYTGEAQTLWQDGPLETDVPAGDALKRREGLFFERQGALVEAYPELEARTGGVAAVATAVLPMFLDDRPLGVLILDFKEPHHFTEDEIRFLRTLAAQCAVALGRAALQQNLEARVAARTAELEGERAALDAFVRFTEASARTTDPLSLAREARDVLQTALGVQVGYSELEDGCWKGRIFSDDTPPEVIVQSRAGFSAELPSFARPFEQGDVVFVDGWNAQQEGAKHTETYGAAALYPYVEDGQPHGLLTMGIPEARPWTERERQVFQAVGRSLALAIERTEQAQRLVVQNAELDARTRALEGFALLTQDLATQSDPHEFVRRAQEFTLSLLTPGYALYYERDTRQWRSRVQVGDVGNADLQAFIDAGPLVGQTPSIDVPWTTQQPYYQEDYVRGSDTPPEMVQHVTTVASLPVLRHGVLVGVFVTVLFDSRCWTPTDKVVLETVVGSLGLALERAEQAGELQRRTAQLERSNAELEQFAYIASHDLQAPIRAVTSFAGMIERRYGDVLDERGRLYLRQIVGGGEHMKRLVDDLLTFSRVHTEQREFMPVKVAAVFDTVAQRLRAQSPESQITCTPLPVVLADAPQLDQLFQNLISNGLKYRRDGVVPRVKVSAQRNGEMWRFAVADNGIGIEPQYFERIFEIFQRLHGRDTYEGTGIGLAVCKKIVERHGGRLWLESTPGEGSTFFFTLPGLED
ncbi:GAF domain-containing protein [Deinococcus sp. Arct2-2]|uniref:GAF domain-containing protein n=1 Tax=Deinococcus sp. Arct2-2 TaxID=2568653 RepID=UPI0010A3966B|nr:GAF domain-containing protein [Deinococcus sp. Arct2-2]THF69728.1 GAF domain-containing protein [Deinococcus sp. Arct2-2]